MNVLATLWLLLNLLVLPTAIFANERHEWEDLLAPDVTPFSMTGQSEDLNQVSNQTVEDQILRVDQEILILKAELAYQRGRENALKNYLHQLDKMGVLPRFQARVARLKQQPIVLKQSSSPSEMASHLIVSGIQPLQFSGDKDAVVAILLPLTGDFERVGNQLLESLLSGLEEIDFLGSLVILDTALYDSAFDVWQQAKHYEPSFVFGPLRKSIATQWQALNTGIPILYFNEMPFLNGHERALSPSRVKGVTQLMPFLEAHAYRNILVLSEESNTSQKLESAFYSKWHSSDQSGMYLHQVVKRTVGEAVEEATNVKHSKARKYWLQKKIGVSLVFEPRVREDIEVVISFVSERNAIQIAPILNFYQLTDVPHVWFPIQTSTARFLAENQASWHNTYALLPPLLYQTWQKRVEKNEQINKSGLFYALGQVAVEIVNNPLISNGLALSLDTEFGTIISDSIGQFYLLPVIYSLDSRDTQ